MAISSEQATEPEPDVSIGGCAGQDGPPSERGGVASLASGTSEGTSLADASLAGPPSVPPVARPPKPPEPPTLIPPPDSPPAPPELIPPAPVPPLAVPPRPPELIPPAPVPPLAFPAMPPEALPPDVLPPVLVAIAVPPVPVPPAPAKLASSAPALPADWLPHPPAIPMSRRSPNIKPKRLFIDRLPLQDCFAAALEHRTVCLPS